MMPYVTGTLATITEIVNADNEEHGLPVRGRPVGRGPHVPINADPNVDPAGWTIQRRAFRQSPVDPAEYSFEIDDETADVLAAKLTGLARAALQSRGALSADWDETQNGGKAPVAVRPTLPQAAIDRANAKASAALAASSPSRNGGRVIR